MTDPSYFVTDQLYFSNILKFNFRQVKEIGDFKKAVLSHLYGENGQPLNEDDFVTDAQQPVSDDDDDDLDDWLNFAKDIQTINNDDDDDGVLLVEA